jgi:hypothetical protein
LFVRSFVCLFVCISAELLQNVYVWLSAVTSLRERH